MDDLLSVPEVAELLKVTPRAVLLWIHAGKLRALQNGPRGRWKIHRFDLERFARYNTLTQEVTPRPQDARKGPKERTPARTS